MRRFLFLVPLLGAAALTSVLVHALGSPGPALLTNGDFENGTDGWQVLGADLSAVDDPAGDDHAASVTVTSTIAFLQQSIAVGPDYAYRFTGDFIEGDAIWVQPGLQAYNERGGLLDPNGVVRISSPGAWSFDVETPCAASFVQVRVAVYGTLGAVAYVDDLVLKAVPRLAPCATDTPTPSDTPQPTETSTAPPTATRTATPTRTPTSSRTPTATRTPASTRTPTSVIDAPPTDTPVGDEAVPATATPSPAQAGPATPTLTPSKGLLMNGGYEAANGSAPAAWRHFGGEFEQTAAHVHSGDFAGLLRSATASTKWVYQTVRVDPGAWYEFAAYVYHNDPGVDAAWLRVSWYTSDDASGTSLATSDSLETLAAADAAFRLLSTGSIAAPDGAHSANARIVLRPVSASEAWIAFDDATFAPAAPATPTATATPDPTATPTPPAPTATATSSRTATPVLTATPTRTSMQTPANTPTATAVSSSAATSTPTSQLAAVERTPTQPAPSTPTTTAVTTPTPSNGLLVNGGFEAMDGDELAGWQTYGGDVARVAGPVWSGDYAGAFASSTASTKWLYQTVPVAPNGWYTFSAYVFDSDSQVEGAFLRISWYGSGDGSGSALASGDSTESLDEPLDSYRQLTTGSVQAPPDARSAKARVVLRPRSASGVTIYVDEAWFVSSAPDAAPTEQPVTAGSTSTEDDAPYHPPSMRSSSRPLSEAEALARPAVAFLPQPSPVIRRSSSQVLAATARPNGASSTWWHWALPIGVACAVGGAGWGAWWRDRRRRSPM